MCWLTRQDLSVILPPRRERGRHQAIPFRAQTGTTSLPYKQFGNGATLDNGFLMLSKIGRIAVRSSSSIEGTPKTARFAGSGWLVCLHLLR